MNKTRRQTGNERGFVSLVVALTLIIILALLTVGFAQLSRREQRQALDKQLSVQAYYAAESGINDAVKAIEAGSITNTMSDTDGKTCVQDPPLPDRRINVAAGVSYSCVLIDLQPTSLVYTNVAPDVDHTATFSTDVPLSSLTIQWNSSDGHTTHPANTNVGFLPFSDWNSPAKKWPGVIKFDLTPILDPASVTRDSLINSAFTTYLYPASGGSNIVSYNTIAPAAQGSITSGKCSPDCRVTINNIPAVPQYLIRFLTFYDTSNVTITGKGTTSNVVHFINGQAMIDVTGKAQDVLKRLQVRVPLGNTARLPNYAIEAQNICKRLDTEPTSTKFIALNGSNASSSNDPACLLN